MKLVSVTWSYSDGSNVFDSVLYKSFIKNNDPVNFHNIHFNRNNFIDLEKEFENKFGYQYEFLLYRIYLLKDKIEELPTDVYIFSDTSDVVCLDNIDNIKLESGIMFSAERHQYPNDISSWTPTNSYNNSDKNNSNFLNAGLQISDKSNYVKLLNTVIEKVFPLEYKSFGGDQGVFTYYYVNEFEPKIVLDANRDVFVSTYLTGVDWYKMQDNRVLYKPTNTQPIFVHDNGWNYGSPKITQHLNLL
jgi:hypothetical protein